MSLSEFELIAAYFSRTGTPRRDVVLGVGGDCALLQVPPDQLLAVSIDTLVEGVHFLPGTDPESLGHKALAVNLSDLAAAGAAPAWATLALTIPASDVHWLAGFSRGFGALAERYGLQLVGGDTTRGPLTISVQVHGFTAPGRELRRDRALPGDRIGVTGSLGDAALALRAKAGLYGAGRLLPGLEERLDRPMPRIEAGLLLAGLAHAAVDVSDGFRADLGHICEQSGTGARIELDALPLSPAVHRYVKETGDWSLPLTGGDDYELCFTCAPERCVEIEEAMGQADCGFRWVGVVEREAGLRFLQPSGEELRDVGGGYEHFRSA